MLFRNDVAQVSLAARLRFGQHRAGLGIQQGHSRSRDPRLDEHVRILNRRGPGQSIAIAMESLDHMHVLTVEISAELIKPRVAVEAPSVHDKRIPIPVSYALSSVGSVQVLQWRVLAAVTWDHAVHRLGRNETALAGIDKDEVTGKLANVRRNARARNPRGHTVIGRIFFIGIRMPMKKILPI